MSVFVSKVNPTTGKVQWLMQDENYDYNQEIARSAYADMLHDTERNQKYEAGLVAAINSMRAQGRPCNVIDIGTGTGLLSMMAVRNGADTVHACDAFKPAALCAAKIIAANGMSERIKLIEKRSTDVKVPDDMPAKANILVTEVFDTELIGEGAVATFRHALQFLLEPDSIVVPSAARMYIQPVHSTYLSTRNELSIALPDKVKPIKMPPGVERYNNGLAAPLFDLQLSSLPRDLFSVLSAPMVVFRFDFCGREELAFEEKTLTTFTSERDGVCHAFFMWWDLDMDMCGKVQLSCAPHWEHPLPLHEMQWRDHWMQAVFYPSDSLSVRKDSKYVIESRHEEYSLSFNISASDSPLVETSQSAGLLHCVYTRSRLAMLHDKHNISKYLTALEKLVDGSTVALCVSDGSFLPYLLARLGARKIYVMESEFVGAKRISQSIISHNNMSEQICLCEDSDMLTDILPEVNLIAGEPYFSLSILPWDDLQFWYTRSQISSAIDVCPKSACLFAMAVQFDNLHKIRQPVGICEGLNLDIYDKMIEKSRQKADELLEQHSLWEYPCRTLSLPCKVLEFDFTHSPQEVGPTLSNAGQIDIQCDGEWNGMALWMCYSLDNVNSVSFGVEGEVEIGSYPTWNMERKQAVYLPHTSTNVTSHQHSIQFEAKYHVEDADLQVSFSVR